jgi:hypothetical protein
MGGFMAADAAADDPAVIGLFLLDPWNIGAEAPGLATAEGKAAWHHEAAQDLPPLAGTSEAALAQEMIAGEKRFDIVRRIAAFGDRPLAVYGATRGGGEGNLGYMAAARKAGNARVTGAVWDTDHSFSDRRVALSQALVQWLATLKPQP